MTLEVEEPKVRVGPPIEVVASDHLFDELGNNTYDYKDLLSELLDNCLAARRDNAIVHVTITLGLSDSDSLANWLSIKDDATGIPRDLLGQAISPAAKQSSNSLNEHGLGMKQAISGLGLLHSLTTKTMNDELALVVEEFKFGTIYPKEVDVSWETGTEIRIQKLKSIVRTSTISYTRDLVPYLGARYRRFLTPNNPRAEIRIEIIDIDDDGKLINSFPVEEVKPIYFHPNSRTNSPVVDHHTFKEAGWEAELTFGYSPEAQEWGEIGLDQPSEFHPYAVTLSRQGLDVLLNDRVIMFHQLPEIGIVGVRHNNYNTIRGEINLISGFTTAITKNAIIHSEHWDQCMSQIKEYLDTRGLVRSKSYPDALPESALRDRLVNWLKTNELAPRAVVHPEYPVEGLGGKLTF